MIEKQPNLLQAKSNESFEQFQANLVELTSRADCSNGGDN